MQERKCAYCQGTTESQCIIKAWIETQPHTGGHADSTLSRDSKSGNGPYFSQSEWKALTDRFETEASKGCFCAKEIKSQIKKITKQKKINGEIIKTKNPPKPIMLG